MQIMHHLMNAKLSIGYAGGGGLGSFSTHILLDFSLTVKAAPHVCVIRTSQS